MKSKIKQKKSSYNISDRHILFIGIGVLTIGVVFMALGIGRGEMEVVFEKAVNICMECIGIG